MHYEVELRQPDPGNGRTDATWQVTRLIRPRTFTTLGAAQAHAARLNRRETRIVAVEQGGRRRVVDANGM